MRICLSVCRTSSASDVVLLVFVLLVLGDLGDAQRLVLGAAVGLRGRVADVVAALVHVVGALVAVAVLVHGIEEDEDAEGRRRYDAHHHARGAAALPHHFRRTREHLHLREGRAGCKGTAKGCDVTTVQSDSPAAYHSFICLHSSFKNIFVFVIMTVRF